jgi:D-glycero-D-manno-heptose 1,7-bisphosphate phosphatase
MKVIFLDRDGVINEYPGDRNYVTNQKEFKFIAGSIQGIKKLKDKGFKIFVISNQAGVTKGIYSEKDLEQITKKMINGLKKYKTAVDGIFYCRHREEDSCACRKPNTGLMHEALKGFDKPVTVSFFVGDSFRDMNAAKKFGAKPVLVLSGKEKISNRSKWDFEPDYIFDNLLIASYYICSHYG